MTSDPELDQSHSRLGTMDIQPSSEMHSLHQRRPRRGTRPQRAESLAESWDPARPAANIPEEEHQYLNSYGVTEFRDGFFDALFFNPRPVEQEDLLYHADKILPKALRRHKRLPLADFFPRRWLEIRHAMARLRTSGSGIALLKSFLAVFTAYILCLVPAVRHWLGKYNYVIVISAVINHPGRTIGAQIDGTVLTLFGTALGLAWGSLALEVSISSAASQKGYGAIVAVFQCLFLAVIASVRSHYVRFFQCVLCAGIAVFYTCLSDASDDEVRWRKLWEFGIPWVFGQALCLIIGVTIFLDTGARSYATSLHDALDAMMEGLVLLAPDRSNTRRRLTRTFVNLSQAYRDLTIDISITRFQPDEAKALRNVLQAVIRALLAIEPTPLHHRLVDEDGNNNTAPYNSDAAEDLAYDLLTPPVAELIRSMQASTQACAAALMDLSGFRKQIGPPAEVSANVEAHIGQLRRQMITFDAVEADVLRKTEQQSGFAARSEVVRVLAYCRPIRQAAEAIDAMATKVRELQRTAPTHPRFHLPSYPLHKAVDRLNQQVRHDRGGVTAGSYYKAFDQISALIEEIKARQHDPVSREHESEYLRRMETRLDPGTTAAAMNTPPDSQGNVGVANDAWRVLHRLQGFGTRYALKTVMATSLLSIPAWLSQSRGWWNYYQSWWAVIIAWVMMHPRVGPNLTDLLVRSGVGVLGAVWSGFAYAAGGGSPYVMAVFAAIYYPPMLYRFTQSTHPRSGLIGCHSFTIVSLGLVTAEGQDSTAVIAATRGAAIVVGVMTAALVNWLLWPFVGRHELRKASAMMLFFISIVYRNILGKYVYYETGDEPQPADVVRSEILEGRIREGFVRIRQLMLLTRHEIRLRGPFDVRPYALLTDSAESFFEHLVSLRQAALFFHPRFMGGRHDRAAESLLSYRRDAVATVLTNFYILAGALRQRTRVPRYLPSAAAARQRLLDRMVEMEKELGSDAAGDEGDDERRKWLQIYSYSYNESLTGCAAQLEEMEVYTKMIVGEQGFDEIYQVEESIVDKHKKEPNTLGVPVRTAKPK